jgi:hypothetical protein
MVNSTNITFLLLFLLASAISVISSAEWFLSCKQRFTNLRHTVPGIAGVNRKRRSLFVTWAVLYVKNKTRTVLKNKANCKFPRLSNSTATILTRTGQWNFGCASTTHGDSLAILETLICFHKKRWSGLIIHGWCSRDSLSTPQPSPSLFV